MGEFEEFSAKLAAVVETARGEAFKKFLAPLTPYAPKETIIERAGKSLEYIDRARSRLDTKGLVTVRDANSFNLDVWAIAEHLRGKRLLALAGLSTELIAEELADNILAFVEKAREEPEAWESELKFTDAGYEPEAETGASPPLTSTPEDDDGAAGVKAAVNTTVGVGDVDYEKALSRLRAVALDAKQSKLRFLLVGETGVGKSSTINALMGEEIAPVGRHRPTTEMVVKYERVVNGVPVLVFDTPGLRVAPNHPANDSDYLNLIRREANEFHVMLFVTRLDESRVSHDEYTAIKRITAALGPRCWEHALIVFTRANNVEPEHFASDLSARTELLREVIAVHAGADLARGVRSVAVENKSETTPDGKPWLPELFLQVFAKINPKGALPFVVATARPNDPEDFGAGRRITLDDEQRERFFESAKEKVGPEGWLALTFFGTAPVAVAAGVVFGPPVAVAAAIGGIVLGVGAAIFSAFRR